MSTLTTLLDRLIAKGGTDLHLAPGKEPRIRVRGDLVALDVAPVTLSEYRAILDETSQAKAMRDEENGDVVVQFMTGAGWFRVVAGRTALVARILVPPTAPATA